MRKISGFCFAFGGIVEVFTMRRDDAGDCAALGSGSLIGAAIDQIFIYRFLA
jgi:hypothetical protein